MPRPEKPLTAFDMGVAYAPAVVEDRLRLLRAVCMKTFGPRWMEHLGQAFIDTAKIVRSYDPTKTHMPIEGYIAYWLPRKLVCDERRFVIGGKKYRHKGEYHTATMRPMPDAVVDDERNPAEEAEMRESLSRLADAMEKMPPDAKKAVEGMHLGMTQTEEAEADGFSREYIRRRRNLGIRILRAALCAIVLMIGTVAHADVITLSTTDGAITIEGTFPDGFAAATDGNLITYANLMVVTGGGYYPGGFAYLPPVAPTNLPELAGSFAVNYGNAAEWTINLQPNDDPRQIVLGQVVDGWDTLAALAAEPQANTLGMIGLPVDAEGQPFVTTVSTPEASTLLLMLPAAMLLTRKSPFSKG